MLNYIKAVLTSKTMWGIAMLAIFPIAKAMGHEITSTDADGLVNRAQQFVQDAFTFGGFILAVWGRTYAKGPLVPTKT